MKTLFITATIALFVGMQNVNAIKLSQKIEFIDDVAKMLAESEEKDLLESQRLAECNPCYNSSLGPNPHYPYKGDKTMPNYKTEGVTTTYKGPVNSDADIKPAGAAAPAAASLAECNPCYTSNTGPNPYWNYPGNASAKPFGSTSPPVEGGKEEGKKEEEKKALAQIECNPCPISAAGKNPHYPYNGPGPAPAAGAAAAAPAAAAAAAPAAAFAECNPCPNSSAGKNPHYPYAPGGAAAAAGGAGAAATAPAAAPAAAALAECNPCYNSSLGPNTHYDFPGNAKAVPFGTTILPKAAGAAGAAGAPAGGAATTAPAAGATL